MELQNKPGCAGGGTKVQLAVVLGSRCLASGLLTGRRMRQVAAAWGARHERKGAAVYEMLLVLGGLY